MTERYGKPPEKGGEIFIAFDKVRKKLVFLVKYKGWIKGKGPGWKYTVMEKIELGGVTWIPTPPAEAIVETEYEKKTFNIKDIDGNVAEEVEVFKPLKVRKIEWIKSQ